MNVSFKKFAYNLFGDGYETDTQRLFALLVAVGVEYRASLIADGMQPEQAMSVIVEGFAENLAMESSHHDPYAASAAAVADANGVGTN